MGDGVELLVSTGRLPRLRLIGDLLLRRELRCPPDHWGRAAVVWRKGTFWAQIAVPDPPGFAFSTLRACTAAPPGRRRLSESPDGVLQGLVLRHGFALLADAGGVGLPTSPLKD